MEKWVKIEVQTRSWLELGKDVPSCFPAGEYYYKFPLNEVFHLLGVLTTPVSSFGVSLAEYYAWIRYYFTVIDGRYLRLKPEYNSIDPHQKTILSDDFGVAFSMYAMIKMLGIDEVCDGLHFVKELAYDAGAEYIGEIAVNGAQKTPDFIGISNGVYHQIECKGTQSGRGPLNRQIEAGKEQIRNLIFDIGGGETIVSGLFIAKTENEDPPRHESVLVITDPPGSGQKIHITDSLKLRAKEAIARSSLSRFFAASGLPYAAGAILDPDAGYSRARSVRDEKGMQKAMENAVIQKKMAIQEIADVRKGDDNIFEVSGEKYIGSERRLQFPVPLNLDGNISSGVIIRNGVSKDLIDSIDANNIDNSNMEKSLPYSKRERLIKSNSDKVESVVDVPGYFHSSQIFF
ncbi:MAG: hypothetical protein ACT6Q8_01975 [Niveispirillum sp.]|uniref:hypothetical protein n=1 Tax=Niveispirillum sp. TaxID=1917217 RepID=UPI0040363D2F